MDEKDHCSTEDISDSEIHPGMSAPKAEFNSLQIEQHQKENFDPTVNDYENSNAAFSLPYSIDDSAKSSNSR